jgi:hypothetical protein
VIHGSAELAGPEERVEESHHHISSYGFFDTLKARSATKEFF